MNKTTPTLPFVFENEIIKPNANKIVKHIEECISGFGDLSEDNYWQGRVLNLNQLKDKDIVSTIRSHASYMLTVFSKTFDISEPIYVDTLHIVRWTEGYELHPHADAEEPDGRDHPFPWRDFGTVTFLNDDFEGGVLHYPTKNNLKVEAQTGYTAIHSGKMDCLHGVTPITKGIRYTLASFITYNPDYNFFKNHESFN